MKSKSKGRAKSGLEVSYSKGVSPLIAAVILIAMTVVLSVIVSSWLTGFSSSTSKTITNNTREQLNCQFANIAIKSAIYDCSNSCFTGVPYLMNASVENTGKIASIVARAATRLSNGQTYQYEIDDNAISVGTTETINFNSVRVSGNPRTPVETMDRRSVYANDGNTLLLCHFDSTQNCTAVGAGAPLVSSGTTFASGSFGTGITVDGSDALIYNASLNLNTTSGNAELYIKPTANAGSCPGCTFLYMNTSTGDAIKIFTSSSAFAAQREQSGSSLITSSVSYAAGTTYHVAVSWGSGLKLYVNGALQGTNSDQGNMTGTPDKIVVGANAAGAVADSLIDELRISRVPRSFFSNITYDVSFSEIDRVRLYNSSDTLVRDSGNLNGTSSYGVTVSNLGVDEYRIEVTKGDGEVVNSYYPFAEGQRCLDTSSLSGILIGAMNCPSAVDSIPASAVTFVNCI